MAKQKTPWVTIRKIVQAITYFAWLVLFIGTASLVIPAGWAKLPITIDPLLAIATLISGQVLKLSLLLGLILPILTLVFGRAWCGWICPVGATLDLFSFKKFRKNRPEPPEQLRKVKFIITFAILLAALFGNMSLIILDPMTLWTRTLTGAVLPTLNTGFTAATTYLVRFDWLSGPVLWLDQLFRPAILPLEPVGHRFVWLPFLIFTGIILLNLVAERFWCRYLCPLGGLLGWISRIAIIKRKVAEDCTQCGKCSRECPTGTIDANRNFASDPAECTVCLQCLSACSLRKTEFKASPLQLEKRSYDLNRRDFLVGSAVTLTGLAVLSTSSLDRDAPKALLRPPGVNNDEFLQRCLRCGLCLRACPTGALQPSITESGLQGFLSPILVPRLGYCLYSCNTCGQVCPVDAIPALSLEAKQLQVMGHAFIDENRCIPWSENRSCIVCEEMCPLPQKAIHLEEREFFDSDGTPLVVKLPIVNRELCIGCGICEYKCPRSGESAIRVFRQDFSG